MPAIGELGLLAFDLGQTGIGVGGGAVGVIRASLPPEVDIGVAARRGSARASVFVVCLTSGATALE